MDGMDGLQATKRIRDRERIVFKHHRTKHRHSPSLSLTTQLQVYQYSSSTADRPSLPSGSGTPVADDSSSSQQQQQQQPPLSSSSVSSASHQRTLSRSKLPFPPLPAVDSAALAADALASSASSPLHAATNSVTVPLTLVTPSPLPEWPRKTPVPIIGVTADAFADSHCREAGMVGCPARDR